jgi:hypothetical protein
LAYAYLAPALGLSGIGAFAFAGAVGGAFGGLTGAGMSGGNLWQGMLLGMVGGAVGGGVYGAVGGEFGGVIAGAFAGGFVAGGLGTAFNGGNFFQNAMVGAVTSTIMAGVTYGVAKGAAWLWEKWNAMPGTPEAQAKTQATSSQQPDRVVDTTERPIVRVGFFDAKLLRALIVAWLLTHDILLPGPRPPVDDVPVEEPGPVQPPGRSGESVPGSPPPQSQPSTPPQSPLPRVPGWVPFLAPFLHFVPGMVTPIPAGCFANPVACTGPQQT